MVALDFASYAVAAVALGAISLPAVAVVHWSMRRIGRARNIANRCSHCGGEWTADSTDINEAHLVEGLLVCRTCAGRLRIRTRVAEIAAVGVVGLIALTTWGTAISLRLQWGRWISPLKLGLLILPPLLLTSVAGRYLARMREQNRLALAELGRTRLLGDQSDTLQPTIAENIGKIESSE